MYLNKNITAVVICLVIKFYGLPIAAQEIEDSLDIPVEMYAYDYEYVPDATYDTIEARLARIPSDIPLTFNVTVKAFVEYFVAKNRTFTKEVMCKSTHYFPLFEAALAKYDMPETLKYLAVIESGLKPKARSRAAAVGLWQFVYFTGKAYGLHIDSYVDERMDPYQSTESAVRYIKSLYKMFDDWELALAAYNCGPGNVRKALRRSGYKKNFWEVYKHLPRETRGYVPQFIAVAYAFEYAEEHNLIQDDTSYVYAMETDTVMLNGFTNLNVVADMLNICFDDLQSLNPAIKQSFIPRSSSYSYVVYLPKDKKEYFDSLRTDILDSASKTNKKELESLAHKKVGGTYGRHKMVHRVRSGEVLGVIAERYKVRVSDLRRWNNIRGNLIRTGQRLNVWVSNKQYKSNRKARPTTPTYVPEYVNGGRYHTVRQGDTLWDISRAYNGTSIEQIKKWNKLRGNAIKPGQKLRVG